MNAMTTMAFDDNAMRNIPWHSNRSIQLLLCELGQFVLYVRPCFLAFDKALYRCANRILIRPHLFGAIPISEGI